MGACNPKRQIRYEHTLMNELLCSIIPEIEELFTVYSLGEDEIILQPIQKSATKDDIVVWYDVVSKTVSKSKICKKVKVEIFNLKSISGTDGWIKSIYDVSGKVSAHKFKCLNSEICHQVVKHFLGEPITDDDLVFYHDGKLARFLEAVNNPWK